MLIEFFGISVPVPVCCAGAGSLLGLHPGDPRLRLPEVSTEEPSHSLRRHRYEHGPNNYKDTKP